MSGEREAFLQRVRHAVRAGNRAGAAADLLPRGQTGYQGAGPHPLARFCDECAAAGGHAAVVPDPAAAVAHVVVLVRSKVARRVLLGRGGFIDQLGLAEHLRGLGVEVIRADAMTPEADREPFFAADLGITGVDYLIAETGTVVLMARPGEPRSVSLLPPVHLAVAERAQVLPDLFDLFAKLGEEGTDLSSGLTLITGPSKTGDIELRLVTGVHGPGELQVLIVDR